MWNPHILGGAWKKKKRKQLENYENKKKRKKPTWKTMQTSVMWNQQSGGAETEMAKTQSSSDS